MNVGMLMQNETKNHENQYKLHCKGCIVIKKKVKKNTTVTSPNKRGMNERKLEK